MYNLIYISKKYLFIFKGEVMYSLLFLILSLLLGFIVFVITNQSLSKDPEIGNLMKKYFARLYFVKYAPIAAFVTLLVLTLFHYHSRVELRLSHAWYVAQFWTYSAFLFFSFLATKKYMLFGLSILSLIMAIYNTPIYHYKAIFHGTNVIISDIVGFLMFCSMWVASSTIIRSIKSST